MMRAVLWGFALSGLLLGPLACASRQPATEPLPKAQAPVKTSSFRFDRPLVVSVPNEEPATVREHILCGLFYFEHGRYEKAANAFETARGPILDPANSLNRRCLIAEAVCRLLEDDKPAFVHAVGALKATYSSYKLMAAEQRDSQLEVLLKLQQAFARNGHH